jgi:hypothetical protein
VLSAPGHSTKTPPGPVVVVGLVVGELTTPDEALLLLDELAVIGKLAEVSIT